MVLKALFSLFFVLTSIFNVNNVTIDLTREKVVVPETPKEFSQVLDLEAAIRSENIDDLKLTLYSYDGQVLYQIPPSTLDGADVKFEVTGDVLEEHIELFYKIKSDDLTVCDGNCYVYAQSGFVLESAKNGVLATVILWSHDMESDNYYNIRVNGVDVYEEQFFYDIMNAYASQEILDEWGVFFDVERKI